MSGNFGKADRIWLRAMEIGGKTGCHQMPERSFFIKGRQFPVCARCAGVYFGWLISIALIFAYRPRLYIIAAFCLCMFIDWFLQKKNILESNNVRRFITGILGGYALMSLYIEIIIFVFKLIF